MTKLALLISREEGFGRPGARPTRNHNPGDLRHSPHSSHAGEGANDIGVIDTDAHGWEDLERQLRMDASRGMTLGECIYSWAPPSENDSARYLAYVCDGLGMDAATPLAEALKLSAG